MESRDRWQKLEFQKALHNSEESAIKIRMFDTSRDSADNTPKPSNADSDKKVNL